MKCPVCNSSRVTENEKGDKRCNKCGWIHKSGKQPVIFSQIDMVMNKLGYE
jgi:hypothetical protein